MTTRKIITAIFLTLLVLGCILPWIGNAATALSPTPRDLAEWLTLSPQARTATVPLVGSFLTRLALGMAACLLAISAAQYPKLLHGLFSVLAILLLVTLLPPIEFVTSARADINYQQQFSVFLMSALMVGIVLTRQQPFRTRTRLAVAATLVAALVLVVCGTLGVLQGFSFYQRLGIDVGLGIGAIMFIVSPLAIAAVAGFEMVRFKTKPE